MRSLSWKSVAGPAAFAVVATALLVYDHLNRRMTELVFELDGLQAYSDRFGYTAGDELLRRAARDLFGAVAPLGGAAYRVDSARLAVLMAALSARRPQLRDHLRGVAYRAISLARRLRMGVAEIDDIALASELQEVGVLATPEPAPEREAPLDEVEAAMACSDTVAGERIVAVSVAFAAMTAPRPHGAGMGPDEALAELRRHAGTRFDPRIVEALAQERAEEPTAVQAPA